MADQPTPYIVPPLTRTEVTDRYHADRCPSACPECPTTPVPHWPTGICTSAFRRGADGVDRLFRVHCTCDGCY